MNYSPDDTGAPPPRPMATWQAMADITLPLASSSAFLLGQYDLLAVHLLQSINQSINVNLYSGRRHLTI